MCRCFSLMKPLLLVATGLGMGLLIGVGMMVGALVATSGDVPELVLPQRAVQATATHGGSKFAIATGMVGDDSEGVFFLDFITGDLQCMVLNPRTAKFGGHFVANVARDLQGTQGGVRGKAPNYLMVTGQTSFRGNTAANSVVYVVDANTGNFVVYGMTWNRNAESTNTLQKGPMTVLHKGRARNIKIRE